MNDDDLSKVAQSDQLEACLRDTAQAVSQYMVQLVLRGMTREEAFVLARDFQAIVMSNSTTEQQEPGE